MNSLKYFTFGTVVWLIMSWEMMLGIGIMHLHWWHAMPTIGFNTALIIGFLFQNMLTGGTTFLYAIHRGWQK